MRIRSAALEDAEHIAQVHVDSWRTTYKNIIADEYLEKLDYAARAKSWRDILEHEPVIFVAEDNQELVGFCHVDGNVPAAGRDGKGEIYSLYLLEAYQGKGIGSILFNHAKLYFQEKEISHFQLWVLEDNPAVQFYRKMGGRPTLEKEIQISGQALREVLFAYQIEADFR